MIPLTQANIQTLNQASQESFETNPDDSIFYDRDNMLDAFPLYDEIERHKYMKPTLQMSKTTNKFCRKPEPID